LVATSDGGYALAGGSLFVKTDALGNMEWDQICGGSAQSLVATSDGGYAIAGDTSASGAGSTDFWLMKADAVGNTQWSKTYGGAFIDEASSLVATSDGGYAIAGDTWSFGAGEDDFWLVKTDALGNMQWNRTYGGSSGDHAYSVVAAPDGGYALTGYTSSFGAGWNAFWLVKTDALGNMQWNRTYGGIIRDEALSLVATSDGGYAMAGYTIRSAGTYFWLVKTDALGNIQWNQTYGGTGSNTARSLVATSDGGYAIAGAAGVSGFGGGGDFWLVKTDALGNIQWNQTYGGTSSDWAYSLVATSDGGYAIAGWTASFGAGGRDFWLVKTDENGVVPEYSSWLIPSIVLTATAFIITNKKRLLHKRS
jgi:hypothetical protein